MELGRSRKCAQANACKHRSRQVEENPCPYTVRLLLEYATKLGMSPRQMRIRYHRVLSAVVGSSKAMQTLVRSDDQFGNEFTRQ